jgi:hypothetical protein
MVSALKIVDFKHTAINAVKITFMQNALKC